MTEQKRPFYVNILFDHGLCCSVFVQHKEPCAFRMVVARTNVWDTCSVRFYISDCAVKDEVRIKDGCGEWSIWEE